jgi:hypothetical protein
MRTIRPGTLGAFIWTIVGTVVVLVLFSVIPTEVIGDTIFLMALLMVVAPLTATLGALQGAWRPPHGAVAGAAFAMLAFMPACLVLTTELTSFNGGTYTASQAWIILCVMLLTGSCAGALTALLTGATSIAAPWTDTRTRLLFGIWVTAAGVEGLICAPTVFARVRPPNLSEHDVKDIATGSARGTEHSGYYVFRWTDVAVAEYSLGCVATVIQRDGALTVSCPGEGWERNRQFDGAIDADGRFRVGFEYDDHRGPEGFTLELLTGRFVGNSVSGVMLFDDWGESPGSVWRGAGIRCPSLDAEPCLHSVFRSP